MAVMASPVLETARGYVRAGLSVIPIRTDGSKAPTELRWQRYNRQVAPDSQLVAWFGRGDHGIGIPGGPASGNLAVLDFETGDAYQRWLARIPADTADALSDCPRVRTPSGGVHVWVRLPVPVPGTVLARRPDKKTLIEIRGDGHQVLAPGCPPECHPTGRTYEFEARGWLDGGPCVTPVAVWYEWAEVAADLTEWKPAKEQHAAPPRDHTPTDDDPGTDFNRRGTWEETGLFDAGWAWVRQHEYDRGTVRRPGKAEGVSGTVGLVTNADHGWPLFHCFSTNGDRFDGGGSYSRFRVFARLKHNDDFKAAARALGEKGYGRATRTRAARLRAIQAELAKKAELVGQIAGRDDPDAQIDSEMVDRLENKVLDVEDLVGEMAGVGHG